MTTDITANLKLPFILPAQAQKHVTHNEAINVLDALVQLSVLDRNRAVPPEAPTDGERHIVGDGASGAWSGRDAAVAVFRDGGWSFHVPLAGWLVWIEEEERLFLHDGAGWTDAANRLVALNPAERIGVNTTADATNRLAVKSDGVLFSHDDVTPGSGSVRHVLNKADAADTASIVFQDDWSGRAEMGLAGDDDFHFKVSPDGSLWREAMVVDRDDARVSFPAGMIHPASGAPLGGILMTPGGSGVVTFWDMHVPRQGFPRQAVIAAVAGDLLTLTTATADQFFKTTMEGVSYIRLWNVDKSPAEAAWVRALGTTSELYVTEAANIAGWLPGETIQYGEPVGAVDGLNTTDQIIAIDVSQMMQQIFGAVFPQSAMIFTSGILASGPSLGYDAHVAFSEDGSGGSFDANMAQVENVNLGTLHLMPTTRPSPISNSNLIMVRERTANGGMIEGCSARCKGIVV